MQTQKEKLDLENLKVCATWLYDKNSTKTESQKTENYQEGYMDALADIAAYLGIDDEFCDFEETLDK